MVSGQSHRIFVEKASLLHTRAFRFAYWFPTPYGMDLRIFETMKLVEMFNERTEVPKFDQGIDGLFKYRRGFAGDQANNEGMFVPMDAVKAIGQAPWEVAKELQQLTKPV
jgi:hypothetical protein